MRNATDSLMGCVIITIVGFLTVVAAYRGGIDDGTYDDGTYDDPGE